MSDDLRAPLPPLPRFAPVDFGGHKGTALAPIRWPIVLQFGIVVVSVALAFGSSWLAYGSDIMHGLLPDARAIVLMGIIVLQYLPPLVFVALWARKRGARLAETFCMRRFDAGAGIGMAIGFAAAARVVGIQYAVVIQRLGIKAPDTPDVTRLFPSSPVGVMATVLVAVVLAPLAEEALFRGVVFAGLRDRWGQTAGVLVSAALFAVVHFSWFQFVPLFLLGVLLAQLVASTRSIWPSVLCHAAFNGSAVALLYVLRAVGVGG